MTTKIVTGVGTKSSMSPITQPATHYPSPKPPKEAITDWAVSMYLSQHREAGVFPE